MRRAGLTSQTTGITEMRRLIPDTDVINVAEAGHMKGATTTTFAVVLLDFVTRAPRPATT